MKVKLICVGKNSNNFIHEGIKEYTNRISKYLSFEIIYTKTITKVKSSDIKMFKKHESEIILTYVKTDDFIILLDDKGKQYTSIEFSSFLNTRLVSGIKNLVFIIGGAYGFSDELIKLSNEKVSLSKMTFTHQLVRIIFLEQFYRALTILKNEPYHNE